MKEWITDMMIGVGACVVVVLLVVALFIGIAGGIALCGTYMEEPSARAKAEAKVVSIEILNDAEARAEGRAKTIIASAEAQAKEILAKQFKSEDAYLRYLWIKGLTESDNQVIYVQVNENGPIVDLKKVIKQGQNQGASGE